MIDSPIKKKVTYSARNFSFLVSNRSTMEVRNKDASSRFVWHGSDEVSLVRTNKVTHNSKPKWLKLSAQFPAKGLHKS